MEDVHQILQGLMNAGPGTVSKKLIQRLYWGANPRTVAQNALREFIPKLQLYG